MAFDFDLLTLGAGSGGVAASRRAAAHGARVAVVEGRGVGGTCVLRGCVPKKLLMYAAQFGELFTEARGYGWALDEPRFDMARWAAAKAAETKRLEGIYRSLLAGSGVELIEGWARFEDKHRVHIRGPGGERTVSARHILIATGGAPVRDSIPGIEHAATSDDLLDLQALPPAAAVIGGGYIGVEFASLLAGLGVAVSLFMRDRLPLRGFDEMLREAAAAALQAAGVQLHPGHAPQRLEPLQQGQGQCLHFADGTHHDSPWVLNATGRRPNTATLQLERAGLRAADNGAIPVDADLHTAQPHIHAIGDVSDHAHLTPVAIAEGRALADALFDGQGRRVDLSRVPSAVFMLPPLATVGLAEHQALAAGHRLKIFEADFRPMKQAFVGGTQRTRMKLLVDAHDDRVLGLHMAGSDAPEIVQSLAVALSAGATKAHFDRTLAMHPTAAEEFVLMREPSRVVGPEGATPA